MLPRYLLSPRALVVLVVVVPAFWFLLASNGYSTQSYSPWKTSSDGGLVYQPGNRPSKNSAYANSRFTGQADLVGVERPKTQKIMGLVFAGRREFVSILDCYLQRNLVRNGGWLDGVLWIINPKNPRDDEWLWQLTDSVPEYIAYTTREEEKGTVRSYATRYKYCEPDTIYIKIDDDVVFFEDHTIPAVVRRLEENPQYFAVSGNIVNNPMLSWVHYHVNAFLPFWPEVQPPQGFLKDDAQYHEALDDWRTTDLPQWNGPEDFHFTGNDSAPFKNHRWLPLPRDFDIEKTPVGVMGQDAAHEYNAANSGFRSWAIAAQGHYSFLTHLQNDELWHYKFDLWHYHYDRLSINFFAFRSNDIFANPITGSDEAFLTVHLPRKLRRPVVLEGTALAVHFGFQRQVGGHGDIRGAALNDTDLIHRYKKYAEEFVCGKPWGSPMV